jgi:hypothetical protein
MARSRHTLSGSLRFRHCVAVFSRGRWPGSPQGAVSNIFFRLAKGGFLKCGGRPGSPEDEGWAPLLAVSGNRTRLIGLRTT